MCFETASRYYPVGSAGVLISNLLHECSQRSLPVRVLQPCLHAEMQGIWPLAELDPRMFRYFPVWHWLELFSHEYGIVVIHKVRFRVAEDVAKMKVCRVYVNPQLFVNLSHDGFLRPLSAVHSATDRPQASWLQHAVRATSEEQPSSVTREKNAARASICSPESGSRERVC